MPQIELAGSTNIGRVRRNNEDVFKLFPHLRVALVADGMGGAACGEVAAGMTADCIRQFLENAPDMDIPELLLGAIRFANQKVWQAAQSSECEGMGTTVVLAHWEGNRVWIANVGDSRAYLYRNGQLTQLSYDQNLANELRNSLGLSEHQISNYPQRHALTMAIGTRADVQPRLHDFVAEPGDLVLLCSDGLSNPGGDELITGILAQAEPNMDAIVERLVAAANEAGGPDNITAVLLRCTDSPAAAS